MMPSCDHTGVPGEVALAHFHSSMTSGSAALMSLRILPRVSPRQSPSAAILSEIRSDADSLASDFFMFLILDRRGRQIEPVEPIRIRQDIHLNHLAAGNREADHGEQAPIRKTGQEP